jgi:hypothetical protein
MKDGLEQLALDFGIHCIRAIDADNSRVKWNIRELSGGSYTSGARTRHPHLFENGRV